MSDELEQCRRRIDEIDETLQTLIDDRVRLAKEIGAIKREAGWEHGYRPEREAQILRAVVARNDGPLSDEQLVRIFREVISATMAAESPIKVGYLGPEGTYTHAAALKHFGASVTTLTQTTIDDVFRAVETGEVDYGVVPVENSLEGMISHTLDSFFTSPLSICGEILLRIRHQLLSNATAITDVHRVVSHAQSLAQCRSWLTQHLPNAELVSASSNAEAVKRIRGDAQAAAIAGAVARDLYDVPVLHANIEDDAANTTRFLVIGSQETPQSGRDKTSLMVSNPNKPGALHRILSPLAEQSVSMTRIESRPSKAALWEYVFFIDVEGHIEDPNVRTALEKLEVEAGFLRSLGSYPRAVL
ncbi:MAG: P-protein [Gammaproteobacteria bacterium]|nr:P-protein [Gammaproteobacteria bacterium]